MNITFVGASRRLNDIDLPKLGAKIGVGEDEIHAFLDVETRGHGFDELGRPVILFEPHVFYRNLSGATRAQAVRAGLAAKAWGAIPYGKESDQYPRLKAAMLIDETAALKSASWGLGQVLGENFEAAGFLTVQAMVDGMMQDEEIQLEAAINFIIDKKLDDNLRNHDWAGFALGYNGALYRRNAYDRKLAEAFRKWSRIKDTPWPPPAPTSAPPPVLAPPPPNGTSGPIPAQPEAGFFASLLAKIFSRKGA
ncbi:N-acetylmuramidase family protein [Rhizobiales bacterium 3FA27D7]|jgi:hypothetical protein|uniref:N-acetylmuramidase family protein n=1 Tax=Mesorhizobium sp. 2RAF21 TaxID=3232995 RepID=UPI0010F8302E